jgi:hypothetical protein
MKITDEYLKLLQQQIIVTSKMFALTEEMKELQELADEINEKLERCLEECDE